METQKNKEVKVENPFNLSYSEPAMEGAPEYKIQPWNGPFIETNIGEKPDLNYETGNRIGVFGRKELWQIQSKAHIYDKPPVQSSNLLDLSYVRSQLKPQFHTKNYRPLWMAHESRPKLAGFSKLFFPKALKTSRTGPGQSVDSLTVDWPQIVVDSYPWCTIGKINTSLNKQGTGVLVGRNLMLTASHIIPWGQSGWWMTFDAGSFDGGFLGRSYVSQVYGYTSPDDGGDRAHDYAICQLYTPLGDSFGWMGSHGTSNESFYENDSWTTVGYPGDSPRPHVEMFVNINDADQSDGGQELDSDFVTFPGWSGGPLWSYIDDQPKVVGICSGYGVLSLSDWVGGDQEGVFSGGPDLPGLIQYANNNWPMP